MLADEKSSRRQPHVLIMMLAAIGAMALVAVAFLVGVVVLAVSQVRKISETHPHDGFLPSGSSEKMVAGIRFDFEVTPESADEVLDMLDEASQDKRVAGVLIDMNSPGGTVVASQEIYDAIADVRESLPVVVYVREMAASGAYYAASAASRIIANRASAVGSIGVIMSSMEMSELFKWAKLKPITIKSGALKDAGSPNREFNDGDKAYLQKLINDTRDQFVADVKEMRKLSDEAVAHMADGRVVLGPEAVELKLIDSLGTKQDALDAVAELAGVKETPELIYMERPATFADSMRQFLREESLSQEIRRGLVEILQRGGEGSRLRRR